MLQQMRKLPKWVGFVILLPITASFIVWGIADIFRGDVDTSLGSVGGTKINEQEFTRDLNNARRRAGAQLTPAKSQALAHQLLQQMIDQTALDNAAHGLGLITTDDQVASTIRGIPGFRGPLGAFDQATFQQVLQQYNYTEASFVSEIRGDLTRAQLTHAGSDSVHLPPGYVRAIFAYLNERRAVQYVVLPPDAAGPLPAPSDATLLQFVKAHANAFSTPEYREVTYAVMTEQDAEKQVQVTDAQLRAAYELRKDTYVVPDKRNIQRIDFPDLASAKAARAKIDSGTKFEDIAKARGTSPTALDLGSLASADLGPIQGPAAFALPLNGISQPVKNIFGWSILRVTGITPGKTTTFEQAKPELYAGILKELAASKMEDVVNAFDDARNTGDDLAEAAKKVGMRVVHVAATDAHGMAPDGTKANVPASPEFLEQVFKSDVGNEGDPFTSADGNRYVLKVDGLLPQKLKPLDAVRAQASAAWSEEQRILMLGRKAAELASAPSAGSSLAAIAAQYRVPLQASQALERGEPTPAMGSAILTKIFAAAPPKAVSGPTADGKSFIVARITGVVHPQMPLGDPRLQQFLEALSSQASSDILEAMAASERNDQGVKMNQAQVDHVVGGENP